MNEKMPLGTMNKAETGTFTMDLAEVGVNTISNSNIMGYLYQLSSCGS